LAFLLNFRTYIHVDGKALEEFFIFIKTRKPKPTSTDVINYYLGLHTTASSLHFLSCMFSSRNIFISFFPLKEGDFFVRGSIDKKKASNYHGFGIVNIGVPVTVVQGMFDFNFFWNVVFNVVPN